MSTDWEPTAEGEQKDVAALRLTEKSTDSTTSARQEIVGWLVGSMVRLWQRFLGEVQNNEAPPSTKAIGNATKLASEAATGKLEAASLEGNLKLAEIAQAYANARLLNAQAKKIEEETALLRVEKSLEVVRMLGVKLEVARLPDGTPALLLGDEAFLAAFSEQSAPLSNSNAPHAPDQANRDPQAGA